jgi:hypothetical protein
VTQKPKETWQSTCNGPQIVLLGKLLFSNFQHPASKAAKKFEKLKFSK